jgi:type I restriction enzyme S subunit
LAEVVNFNPTPPSGLVASSEEVAFVPMAAVSELGSMKVQEHRRGSEITPGLSYFQNSDVLVAKITPCYENNKITVANIDRSHGFGSTEFHVLRPNASALDSHYLSYFLRQDTVRSLGTRRMTGSAGQRRVPKAFLEQLEILLPPLDEQRRIAAILDQADALRRKRRSAANAMARLRLAVFFERFGAPEANPRNLPILEFGSLICSGPTNGLYKPASEYGEGTRILRIGDFSGGRIEDVSRLRRLKASAEECRAYALAKDEIVVNRVNSREHLGKSTLVPKLAEPTVFESNMMRIGLDRQQIDPVYCITFLQLPFIKKQILQRAKDAINQSSINQKDVRSFQIMLPPLEEQKRFASALGEIERVAELSERQGRRLDALFASIEHCAFRGELTAKAVQREVVEASLATT